MSCKFPFLFSSFLFLCLLQVMEIYAQEQDLGQILITGTKLSDQKIPVAQSISVVSAQELESRGVNSIAQALKTVAGVELSDYGPQGAQNTVTIRGSTSNQVLILVDGHRVNQSFSGLSDLSNLTLDNVDHIEVLKGGASSIYGADALGGVVNIISKKKITPWKLKVENLGFIPTTGVENFSFNKETVNADPLSLLDTQSLSFAGNPLLADTLWGFSGSFERGSNRYGFIDSNNEKRIRQNAQFMKTNGQVSSTLDTLWGLWNTDFSGYWSQVGVPGSLSSPTLNASQNSYGAMGNLSYKKDDLWNGFSAVNLTSSFRYENLTYKDSDTPSDDSQHQAVTVHGGWDQKFFFTPEFNLLTGVEASDIQARSDTFGSPQRVQTGVYSEILWKWGSLTLRPSIRWDYYSDFFVQDPLGGLAGTLAAAWQMNQEDILKWNFSRSYRVPTFEDLYWPASTGVEGNKNLSPESGYETTLGFEKHKEDFSYTLNGFVRYSKNVILWQEGSDGTWRPSNYGAALYPGIEQEWEVHFLKTYWAKINYTFLYTYLLDNGYSLNDDKRLPLTPVHTFTGVFGFTEYGFSWSFTGRYESLRYLKTANAAYLDAYFTLDAFIKKELFKNFSIYFAADNLFGQEYQVVEGYPMPTTKLRLGLETQF